MNNNITVIGIGKLGLGFSLLLENSGYNVMGIDIFPEYVNKVNNKTMKSLEPGYNELLHDSKHFLASTDFKSGVDFSDTIFIIVQTPNSGGDKFYDHSILSEVLTNINRMKPENKDIIIGCTVMPNYINKIGKVLLSECTNCHLSYNPEFIAQGDIIKGFRHPDMILVGTENPNLHVKICEIYGKMCTSPPKFCFMKPLEAEIVKISLNGFITTKISFANMISDLCDTIGADKHVVLNSIGTDSRIGNKYFRPGYSFGGPCFPRDTKALKQLMDRHQINSQLLESTTKYNDEHVRFQANQLLQQKLDVYIFEGVCYKENSLIPLIEESAKLKIAAIIVKEKQRVIIRDTALIIQEVKKEYGDMFEYDVIHHDVECSSASLIETCDHDKNMIDKVYDFWNKRPCNIKHSDKEIGTKEYFEEVTKRKYFVESHILAFADFAKYSGKQVLEVGCGIGTAAQSFAENGAIYTGIDLSDYSIELAKKRFELFQLSGNLFVENIETLCSPILNNHYDLVYSFGVLHHTPNTEQAIRCIYEKLKPGGEFKLMMYARNSYKYYQICSGMDQYEAQSGVPIANVYSNDEIHTLLHDFQDIQIVQTHIFPWTIEEYKQYRYVKTPFFEAMTSDEFNMMERILGWHLCITCKKPIV
jgi:UDPglucose 6-dehydrogenase